MTRRLLLPALLLILAAALVGAGCGDDSDSAGASTAAASTAGTRTAAPGSVPIEARVISDALAGLEPTGAPKVLSTAEGFVRGTGNPQLDEVTVLHDAGFVTGAVTQFGDGAFSSRSGLSAVAQLGSPTQAQALAEREAAFLDGLQTADAVRSSLPGVPGSRTTTDTATTEGPMGTYATVVFTDGPFLYVIFGGAAAGTVEPQAVLDDASALYTRVKGAPAP